MDANFDADLEQLEYGGCTVQPRDEVEALFLREEMKEEGILDGLYE